MKKFIFSITTLVLIFSLLACTDHVEPLPEPQSFSSEAFVSGLKSPIGMALDDKGNIWVTEAGTGGNKNDGSVVMITPAGIKTIFVTGLLSVTGEGSPEGLSHLQYHNGKLYFLHGVNGKLYTANVSSFKSGDAPMKLTDIPSEDISTYIKSLALTNPLNSNAYDLTFGPDDHLYIVDAGSNAIIKKDKATGTLSLFARFPNAAPGVDAVPTGIVYDGSKLLVSNLTGFPFALGASKIFQVNHAGTVSEYKANFTTLTGITISVNNKPIVIQHGIFGAMGFAAKSGKVLLWETTSETNSAGFVIMHSADGKKWQEIGSVTAAENSTEQLRYNFTDVAPLPGANLYKLKMIDLDGTFAYSTIRSIEFPSQNQIVAFPNPTQHKIRVKLAALPIAGKVWLVNTAGIKFLEFSVKESTFEIDLGTLASGTYLLTTGDGKTVRLVKQ